MRFLRSSRHHNDVAADGHYHIEKGIILLEKAAERAQLVRDGHQALSDHHAAAAAEAHADVEYHAGVIESVADAFYGAVVFADDEVTEEVVSSPEVEA